MRPPHAPCLVFPCVLHQSGSVWSGCAFDGSAHRITAFSERSPSKRVYATHQCRSNEGRSHSVDREGRVQFYHKGETGWSLARRGRIFVLAMRLVAILQSGLLPPPPSMSSPCSVIFVLFSNEILPGLNRTSTLHSCFFYAPFFQIPLPFFVRLLPPFANPIFKS